MGEVAISLGRVCRRARQSAGLRAIDIATTAEVSEATISRFEAGGRWIDRVEDVVSAYEQECRLDDLELWRRAIEQTE